MRLSETCRQRLGMAIGVLERARAQAKRLYMGVWTDVDGCNTVCCAVGHCCYDPEFNKEGLHFGPSEFPKYKDNIGWDAVSEFFNTDFDEYWFLFAVDGYSVSQSTSYDFVINRIRKFLEFDGDIEKVKESEKGAVYE
jgi:hypothetical protein